LKKAGRGEAIIEQLNKWKEYLNLRFSTFPEHGVNSRSDCHAWSSHLMYHLLNSICGISPGKPGFQEVRIEPQLGTMESVEGKVAHPSGTIQARYERNQNGTIHCEIVLPDEIPGVLQWKGKSYSLQGGENKLLLDKAE